MQKQRYKTKQYKTKQTYHHMMLKTTYPTIVYVAGLAFACINKVCWKTTIQQHNWQKEHNADNTRKKSQLL